jgi:hypothetical protein
MEYSKKNGESEESELDVVTRCSMEALNANI